MNRKKLKLLFNIILILLLTVVTVDARRFGNVEVKGTLDVTDGVTQIASDTSNPGTCTVGELFIDTNADVNGSLYICIATDTWKEVDDDGAAGGGGDLLADGTIPLTANWDVGAYTITGTQFISDIATGTAPFVAASTTKVNNLNADRVDNTGLGVLTNTKYCIYDSASETIICNSEGGAADEVGTLTTGDMCTNDGSAVQCTVNTETELETAMDGLNIVTVTADDISSANLITAVSDETGSGVLVFGTSPALSGVTLSSTKKRVFISATAGLCRTTTGCTDPTQSETTTNKTNYMGAAFANDADDHWQSSFTLPENYDAGTFTAAVEWTCTADASKGVAWFIQIMSIGNDDALDTAYGTAVEINDDGTATGDFLRTAESGAITASGSPAGGDRVWIQVYRDVSDADDDLTTSATFLGVWLTFGIDALSTED